MNSLANPEEEVPGTSRAGETMDVKRDDRLRFTFSFLGLSERNPVFQLARIWRLNFKKTGFLNMRLPLDPAEP